jgi:hypothetical protein
MRARRRPQMQYNCSANNTIKSSVARSSRFRVFRADPDGIIRTLYFHPRAVVIFWVVVPPTDRVLRRGWRRRAIIITAVCSAPLRIPCLTSIMALASVITWPLWSTNPSYLFKTAPFLLASCVVLLRRLLVACFGLFFEFSPLPWDEKERDDDGSPVFSFWIKEGKI